MNVELSSQHDQLVAALYDIRDKFKDASLDERLIVEAAIHLLEYLPGYKHSADREEVDASPQGVEWMSGRIDHHAAANSFGPSMTSNTTLHPLAWSFTAVVLNRDFDPGSCA